MVVRYSSDLHVAHVPSGFHLHTAINESEIYFKGTHFRRYLFSWGFIIFANESYFGTFLYFCVDYIWRGSGESAISVQYKQQVIFRST